MNGPLPQQSHRPNSKPHTHTRPTLKWAQLDIPTTAGICPSLSLRGTRGARSIALSGAYEIPLSLTLSHSCVVGRKKESPADPEVVLGSNPLKFSATNPLAEKTGRTNVTL